MSAEENSKKRILIIDDDETITSLIEMVLSNEGYSVTSANNGIEGEKLAKEIKPHLIFMDITMPEQDGYVTTEHIKSNPELADIPVVFLTGQSAKEDNGKAFSKGGASFICKPFANQQLISLAMLILETVNTD